MTHKPAVQAGPNCKKVWQETGTTCPAEILWQTTFVDRIYTKFSQSNYRPSFEVSGQRLEHSKFR